MKTQFQIVMSDQLASQESSRASRPRFIRRLQLFFGGLLLAAIAIGMLIFAFVLGFVIVSVLWVALSVAIVALILRGTFRQVNK
jgi:hypothetical protein